MLGLISIIFLLASLISCLLLDGSMFWSILTAVFCLGFLFFHKFHSKKLKLPIINIVSVLAIVFLFFLSLTTGMNAKTSGYISYDTAIVKADDMLQKKEFYKALDVLDKLEKDYGVNDRILLMKAQAALGNSDINGANQYLSRVSNKKDQDYFTLLSQSYYLQRDYKKVQETFIEAARTYPLWSEAQLMAGAQSASNKDYTVSQYYLLRASEQMTEDPRPLYYLGVVSFEQGDYQLAQDYFSDAVQLGPDDELAGYIAWYQKEMGGDVK
jgi:Uncharacterized enzyme of heme biosynthesis